LWLKSCLHFHSDTPLCLWAPGIRTSVSHFIPSSLITTIRRGGSEDGVYVGEFDLRGNSRSAVVRLGAVEKWLTDVLIPGAHKHKGVSEWKWRQDLSHKLYWVRDGTVLLCKLGAVSGVLLARFQPPNYVNRKLGAAVCKLEVSSNIAHEYIDEIFVCALILERRRVTNANVRD